MNAPRAPLTMLVLASLLAAAAGAATALESRRALIQEGGRAFRQREFLQAARLWHQAGKLGPSAALWYRVGYALYKGGKAEKAKAAFRKALELDPDHERAGRALARLERPPPEPTAEPADPGHGDPADPPALDRLAGVTVDVDATRAEQAWTDAHRFHKAGEYARAVGRFVEAYQAGYTQSEVDFYLGQALLEDEVLDGALVHLRRAREAVPDDQGTCLLLGKAYALLGESSDQIEALEAAVGLDPGYGEAHFQLALAFDMVGDAEGVLEHSQKAIRIDPSYRDKLEDALRDGAVVGRLRDLLKATLRPDDAPAPPDVGELDGYATRVAQLLYPDAVPDLGAEDEAFDEAPQSPKQAMLERQKSGPLRAAGAKKDRLRSERLGNELDAGDDFGASEDLADAGGLGDTAGAGAPPPMPSASSSFSFSKAADSDAREAPAGATLAGIQFRLVREILQDLHEGKGRRAFERVPHADRARFKQDFLRALRGRPGLAALRVRVEAALRER